MPIYRYRCDKCGHEEKKLQSINAEPLERCTVCGGKMRKQIGMIGIKFSGSGYYVTDTNAAKKPTTHPGTEVSKTNKDTKDSKPSEKVPKKV